MPLVGRMDAAYSFIHVTDAVRAIDAALRHETPHEVMFIGIRALSGRWTCSTRSRQRCTAARPSCRFLQSILRVASAIGEGLGRASGRPLPLNRSRFVELSAEGFVCRVDRVRERLGVVAEMDLRAGFADTASWYRAAGWL